MENSQFKLNQMDKDIVKSDISKIEQAIIQQKILKRIYKFVLSRGSAANTSVTHKNLIEEMVKFISYFYDKERGDWEIFSLLGDSIFVKYWNKDERAENKESYSTIDGFNHFFSTFLDVLQQVNIDINVFVLIKGIFSVFGTLQTKETEKFLK